MHSFHLLFQPEDLYQYIIIEKFPFYRRGYSENYILNFKYSDFYELGFHTEKGNIPSDYSFKGKLKAEFIIDKKSVLEREITSDIRCYYSGKDMKHYGKVALLNFPIPLKGQKNNITLKLKVIKSDLELEKFKDSIKLYVAVSGVP